MTPAESEVAHFVLNAVELLKFAKGCKTGFVYELLLGEQDSGPFRPAPISRFLGTDRSGTLYIGKAPPRKKGPSASRVAALSKGILGLTKARHTASRTWHSLGCIGAEIDTGRLRIRVTPSSAPALDEKRLFDKYEQKFGELPPLNRSR